MGSYFISSFPRLIVMDWEGSEKKAVLVSLYPQ